MSALAEQHERWNGARERLWKPRHRMLRVEPLPKPEPVADAAPEAQEVVVLFAPFNFLKTPGPMAILKLVALKHHVGVSDIRGPSRVLHIAAARHEAVWLLHKHCTLSLPAIGRLIGGRDHTTAINSIRVFEAKRRQGAR